MKLYFVDIGIEDLKNIYETEIKKGHKFNLMSTDSYDGYTNIVEAYKNICSEWKDEELKILTNQVYLLSELKDYTWNEELNKFEIYMYDFDIEEFIDINDLTNKEIRQAHNIEKLYRNGCFNEKYNICRRI